MSNTPKEQINKLLQLYGGAQLHFICMHGGNATYSNDELHLSVKTRSTLLVSKTMLLEHLCGNSLEFELKHTNGGVIFSYNDMQGVTHNDLSNSYSPMDAKQISDDISNCVDLYNAYYKASSSVTAKMGQHLNKMSDMLHDNDLWQYYSYKYDTIGYTSLFDFLHYKKTYSVNFTDVNYFNVSTHNDKHSNDISLDDIMDLDDLMNDLLSFKKQLVGDERKSLMLAIIKNRQDGIILNNKLESVR